LGKEKKVKKKRGRFSRGKKGKLRRDGKVERVSRKKEK
jgi:hypothetical protein